MFIPEWLIGVLGTIIVEIILLVGYAIYIKGRDDNEKR